MTNKQVWSQKNDPRFNQYWFYVPTPSFFLYRSSNSYCMKKKTDSLETQRLIGISVPKNIDPSKKYKYLFNLDFNIDGVTSDWMCGTTRYCNWGGIMTGNKCVEDPKNLMKLFSDLYLKFIDAGYIIVHTSMIHNDVYFNKPCQGKSDEYIKNPINACWYPGNPDEQYLMSLFNVLHDNNFPAELANLHLDYNGITLFGYSIGAEAVSRYMNEFPIMKTTKKNYPFPDIKCAIMVSGGSMYCYSVDCKTSKCQDYPDFAPCETPDINRRGCCPHTLSETNYDNGTFDWKNHPPVLLLQSNDDNFADPMASTYYHNIMVKHNVPSRKLLIENTIHGLASPSQIEAAIEWSETYNPTDKSSDILNGNNEDIQDTQDNTIVKIVLIVLSVLLFIGGIVFMIPFFYNKELNTKTYIGVILIALAIISLIIGIVIKNKKVKSKPKVDYSDSYLKQALETMSKAPRVTAGELFDTVVNIQERIFDQHPNVGGILVHLLALDDLKTITYAKNFVMTLASGGPAAMTDCSFSQTPAPNCSAWTYLRKDLPPIVYSYPSSPANGFYNFWYPNVGFIVDPNRIWPLVTSMGIVDSDTDARNCGSSHSNINYFDTSMGARCNINSVTTKSGEIITGNDAINKFCTYQSSVDTVGCNPDCTYDPNIVATNCRMRNAGGSLDNYNWFGNDDHNYGWDCPQSNNRPKYPDGTSFTDPNYPNGIPGCYRAEEIDWNDIAKEDKALFDKTYADGCNNKKYKWARWIINEDCYMANPTLYMPISYNNRPSINAKNVIQNTAFAIPPIQENGNVIGRNYLYVGETPDVNEGSATFAQQTWMACDTSNLTPVNCAIDPNSGKNIPVAAATFMDNQLKWMKEDWGRWIQEIKKLYTYMFSTLHPKTGYKNTTDNCAGQSYNYNWIYGNPCDLSNWWENEVNVYSNYRMAQQENSDLNKLFRASIIGMFYVGKTCEELTSLLPTGTNAGNGCNFKNAKERCVGYLCRQNKLPINHNDPDSTVCDNPINGKKVTYKEVKEMELQQQVEAKQVVKDFVSKFNNKYRQGEDGIIGYKLMIECNSFLSYKGLEKMMNGTQTSKDILIPITD